MDVNLQGGLKTGGVNSANVSHTVTQYDNYLPTNSLTLCWEFWLSFWVFFRIWDQVSFCNSTKFFYTTRKWVTVEHLEGFSTDTCFGNHFIQKTDKINVLLSFFWQKKCWQDTVKMTIDKVVDQFLSSANVFFLFWGKSWCNLRVTKMHLTDFSSSHTPVFKEVMDLRCFK